MSSSEVPVVDVATNGSGNGTVVVATPVTPASRSTSRTRGGSSSKKRKVTTPGSSHKDAWETFKIHLTAFYDREKHVNVPQKHKEGGGYNLGRNLTHIRCNQQYVKSHPERRAWLDELGFTWKSPRQNKTSQKPWETFKENLLAFYVREGHSNVPLKHKEGSYNLGRNVSNVRSSDQYIMNHPERREWLESVNFQWELRRKRSRDPKKKLPTPVATAKPVSVTNATVVEAVTVTAPPHAKRKVVDILN